MVSFRLIRKRRYGQLLLGSIYYLLILSGVCSSLSIAQPSGSRVQEYIRQAEQLADIGAHDSAFATALVAINLAKTEGEDSLEAQAYYALGYVYDLSGKLEDALHNYELARKIYARLDIKEEVASCLNSMGVAAYFKGDFELALDYYLQTLAYTEEHAIEPAMLNALNNLGVIYRITNKNMEAIHIYRQSLELSKKLENGNMIATSFQNLGVAYNFEGLMDSALIYLDSAVGQYLLLQDTFHVGHTYTAIGETHYISGGDYGQARKYLLMGASLLDGGPNQEELSKTYLLLARIERDDGNYEKALDYFQNGLAMVEQTDRHDVILEFYKEMEVCYNHLGQKSEAHQYLTKYIALYKQIQSSEKQQAIEELQMRYETEEKDKEIALQEVQLLKGQRQQNLLWGGLLFMFVTAALIMLMLRRKHRYEQRLAWQEQELQAQRIQKLQQEKKILALDYMLEGEENERRRIAKDLHDSLGSLLTSAKMHLKFLKEEVHTLQNQSSFGQAQNIVTEAVDEVRRISHDMMPDALINLGLMAAIEDLARRSQVSEGLAISTHFFDVEEAKLNEQQQLAIYRIIQELVQNTLKHAYASNLIIQLSQESDELHILVEDDGIGFSMETVQQDEGIGLKNIRSRIQYMNGDLDLKSQPGGPTITEITIPLALSS